MLNEEVFLACAIATWKKSVERANSVFTGLDAAALETQVAPGRNRLIYIWGHLSATHDRMLQLLGVGERLHPEFDAIFLSSPDRSSALPPTPDIHAWWTEVTSRLDEGIAKLTTEDWLAKHAAISDAEFAKEPLRNRFSILLSRTNHVNYHLGQVALAPK